MTDSIDKLSSDDLEWIEKFWAKQERTGGYKRPADYIERAQRVLSGEFTGRRRVRTDNWEKQHEIRCRKICC